MNLCLNKGIERYPVPPCVVLRGPKAGVICCKSQMRKAGQGMKGSKTPKQKL